MKYFVQRFAISDKGCYKTMFLDLNISAKLSILNYQVCNIDRWSPSQTPECFQKRFRIGYFELHIVKGDKDVTHNIH